MKIRTVAQENHCSVNLGINLQKSSYSPHLSSAPVVYCSLPEPEDPWREWLLQISGELGVDLAS